RDANVFCISSVVEEEVFAKILLVARAVKTGLAGRGVQRNHPRALLEAAYTRPNFFNDAGEFMPEQRRRDNHSPMIAALVNFEIGPAGEGNLHFHQDLAILESRDGHPLNFHVLFAIEDGCCHFPVHASLRLPGWITIFIESVCGFAASRNASTALTKGKRWLMRRSNATSCPITNRTDSSCRSTDALYEPIMLFSSTQTAAGSKPASPCCV